MAEDGKRRETGLSEAHIRTVQELLSNLKFGSITLVVQDGKIVQIEKHEKVRLT